MRLASLLAACAAAAPLFPLDARYARAAPGQLQREELAQTTPQVPFSNFSAAYVAKALKTPTNWTKLGAVTPVKDQGEHGYCGTFGRVGSAEGQWALRGPAAGKATSFAEEALIDCVGWDKDQYAFFSPRGFMTSAAYPYNTTGPDMDPPIPYNPCRFEPAEAVPGTPGFFTFATGRAPSEDQLAAFIHHNGPVSAGINADVFALREHGCDARGDCFVNATSCAAVAQEIDHSITLVGYGTDAVRGDYWLIKNSWSARWANQGYISVARGVGCAGMCGDTSSECRPAHAHAYALACCRRSPARYAHRPAPPTTTHTHTAAVCGNVFGHGAPSSYYE